MTDARRNYPYWKKRFSDFSGTPLGKVTLWGALFYSISSGILFKVNSFPLPGLMYLDASYGHIMISGHA